MNSPYKSSGGVGRILRAAIYSMRGLRSAWQREAAFRQEVAIAVPLIAMAPFLARSRLEVLLLIGPVLLVLLVELLNSSIEALADRISTDTHPLLGTAKDLGSAAVLVSLLIAVTTWAVVLWP